MVSASSESLPPIEPSKRTLATTAVFRINPGQSVEWEERHDVPPLPWIPQPVPCIGPHEKLGRAHERLFQRRSLASLLAFRRPGVLLRGNSLKVTRCAVQRRLAASRMPGGMRETCFGR